MNIVQTTHGAHFSKQVKLTNIETGEIRIFGSQHSACRELGIHPWALKQTIRGENVHAKGWKAESLNEIPKEDWDKVDKHTTSVKMECPHCKGIFFIKWNKSSRKNRFCSNECRRKNFELYASNGMPQRDENGLLLCYGCLSYKSDDSFYKHNERYAGFAEIRNCRSTKCFGCQSIASKKGREKSKNNLHCILRERIRCARSSSKGREIFFDVTLCLSDLIIIYEQQKGVCPISNQVLAINRERTPFTISLDRKDSSKGYTKNNVQLVCWMVNQMKSNYTLGDLVKWCYFITEANKVQVQNITN